MGRLKHRLSVLLLVGSLLAYGASGASAQRGTFLYDAQVMSDGEGDKIHSIPYAYATVSSKSPGQAGTYCGSANSSGQSRLLCMRLDGANFGESGPIANASLANHVISPFNTSLGYCDYPTTCYPGAIPGDSDVMVGGGSIPNLCAGSLAWPGWYELEIIMAGAATIYSSNPTGARNSAGQWHYQPAANSMGYVRIHVKDASGAVATKAITLRHPFGAANHQSLNITIVGEVLLELPIGRSMDFKPVGSTDWWGATFPSKPTVNHYYITVNAGGTVLSVAGQESNQAPDVPSYDGPPSEPDWWKDMLCSAFCPSETAMSGLQTSATSFASWGPFGYVTTFFALFNSPTNQITSTDYLTMRMQGPAGPPGFATMNDFTLDFRDPTTVPPPNALNYPPYTQGTVYGQLRAILRGIVGFAFWGMGAIGLYRWLRPKQQV